MSIDALLFSLNTGWTIISPIVSNFLAALALLLAGFLLAKAVGLAAAIILKTILLDKWSRNLGLNTLLEKGEIRRSPSELLGDLLYWVIVFITVAGVAQLFGLPVEPALNKVFSYLGSALLAAIVLGLGLFFASLLSGMVRTIGVNLGIEGARTLSKVIYYIIVIFAFLAALAQLGISTDVFVPQIGVITAIEDPKVMGLGDLIGKPDTA